MSADEDSTTRPASSEPGQLLVEVELERSSWVVERGIEHRRWRVKRGGVWMDVEKVRGAVVQEAGEDPEDGSRPAEEWAVRPPGCQYLCWYRLRLPVGTELELIVSRPRQHTNRSGDPLSWSKHVKPARDVLRRSFRVDARGRVAPIHGSELGRGRRRVPRTDNAEVVTAAQMEAAAERLKRL